MRLIPLEIGRLASSLTLTSPTWTDDRRVDVTLPIPAWLIEHPEGVALFDTGLHRDLRHSTDRLGQWTARHFHPDFQSHEELTARLEARGYRPSDIDLIIFSHLHFDHCGGTAEIPDARIVVQSDEWAAGKDEKLIAHEVYNPADYNLGHEVQQVDGSHDVFGDGSIVCVPTPGHTRGHQSLRLELDSGPVVLTGDCVYFEQLLDEMITPRMGSERSRERQLESMRELARLRDEDGCRLIFGHDEDQFRSLPADGLT